MLVNNMIDRRKLSPEQKQAEEVFDMCIENTYCSGICRMCESGDTRAEFNGSDSEYLDFLNDLIQRHFTL